MSDHRPGPGWGRGAASQRAAAAVLANLPSTYQFFHGLPVGRGGEDIDHLVVGPSGVWVISSVRWSGSVEVDDDGALLHEGAPIAHDIEDLQVRAAYARRAVGCEVRPVLCVLGPEMPDPNHRTSGVDVVGVDWLVALITAGERSHQPVDVAAVLDAVGAWRAQPPDHRHPPRNLVESGVAPRAAPTMAERVTRMARRARSASERRPSGTRPRLHAGPASLEGGALAMAAVVALSMLATIVFLLVRHDGTDLGRAIDPVGVAGASTVRQGPVHLAVRCRAGGGTYDVEGQIGTLPGGSVRVSATVGGTEHYLGEFRSFDALPTIGGVSPSTSTGFDIQLVDRDGTAGSVSHLDIATPATRC